MEFRFLITGLVFPSLKGIPSLEQGQILGITVSASTGLVFGIKTKGSILVDPDSDRELFTHQFIVCALGFLAALFGMFFKELK